MAPNNENIVLAGFRGIDDSTKALLDKIISGHADRIMELTEEMGNLHITLKRVHEREKSEKYEIHAKVSDKGRVYAAKVTERNLLTAIDKALHKIINELD